MVSCFDSHIYGSISLCSLVETPDGDQVAAASPSLFPNLRSLIEKYGRKRKVPQNLTCFSLLQISGKMTLPKIGTETLMCAGWITLSGINHQC